MTEPIKEIKQFLSIGESEKEDSSSIWVINISNPKGNINFAVSDGMGGQVVIHLPVTWIPMDATTQATKATILASPRFRNLLAQKMVQIVSEKYALSVMSQASAEEEAKRVYNRTMNKELDDNNMPIAAQNAKAEAMGEVSGFAMNLAFSESLDEDSALNALRGQESVLTKADMQFIAQNSSLARVKEYAAQRVTQM